MLEKRPFGALSLQNEKTAAAKNQQQQKP